MRVLSNASSSRARPLQAIASLFLATIHPSLVSKVTISNHDLLHPCRMKLEATLSEVADAASESQNPSNSSSDQHSFVLDELIGVHRFLTFNTWSEDEDVELALRLLRVSLQQQHSSVNLDSASSEFAQTISELRNGLGYGTSPGFHPTASFPWVQDLQALTSIMQQELFDVLKQSKKKRQHKNKGKTRKHKGLPSAKHAWDSADYVQIAPDWRCLHLWKAGLWDEQATSKNFPKTCEALQKLLTKHQLALNPLMNIACCIARQPAGTGIAPHVDGNLLGLTVHLGIDVPEPQQLDEERCWIEVGSTREYWRTGEVLIMDTTHTHQTRNPCDKDRYVLMMQLLRPRVKASQVSPVAHYFQSTSQTKDARTMHPLSLDTGDGMWRVVYPARMLQRSAEDPTICQVKVMQAVESFQQPSYNRSRNDYSPVQFAVGAVLDPCLFTLDKNGAIDWIGVVPEQRSEAALDPLLLYKLCSGQALQELERNGTALLSTPVPLLEVHRRFLSNPEQAAIQWLPVAKPYSANKEHEELLAFIVDD